MDRVKFALPPRGPVFVGTIVTPRGLEVLKQSAPSSELAEVRVDALLARGVPVEKIVERLKARRRAVLLTLRIPFEGGLYLWKAGERLALFLQLIRYSDAIDIELAEAKALAPVLKQAKKDNKIIVLSAHSIRKSASPDTLKKWHLQFQRLRPDICKIATFLKDAGDLQRLALLLLTAQSGRWAVMGVGPGAPVSRRVLTALGSCLVYGYLDKPAAPGQPSLKELKSVLSAGWPAK